MSYTGFTGYCHASQLTLMATTNNSVANSPCCPASIGENQSSTTTTNTSNMNGNTNDENQLQTASNTSLSSSSSSSVCPLSSPYDSRIISSYPRISGLYGSSYTEQNSFYPTGTNPFYSSFSHAYDLKDPSGGGWSTIPQTTCYPYDPTLYGPYGDRYNAMDSAARRKNATRETTNTLKAWLYEHRKNPYPTKGEKIMLAIITKMTLTQVSTWFANARRRLKKENKMTWEPRNKNSDGHDTDKDSCKDSDDNSSSGITDHCVNGGNKLSVKKEPDTNNDKSTISDINPLKSNSNASSYDAKDVNVENTHSGHLHNDHDVKPLMQHHINNGDSTASRQVLPSSHQIKHDTAGNMMDPPNNLEAAMGQRPKIWSLAQTATSEGPTYSSRIPAVPSNAWSTALPPGPDGVSSLSDYQRECPAPTGLSSSNLRIGSAAWPEDHCVSNMGSSRSAMQLFTSGPIGSPASYLHSAKPATSSSFPTNTHHHHHHHHHPFSTSMPHLVHANHHEAFPSPYNVAANGIRPIIEHHSCHNSLSSETNENRLSNGFSYNGSGSTSKSNTFLCKVFPEYISSGPDALSLNDNASERGGSALSNEETSDSSSSSPNLDSNAGNNNTRHFNASNSAYGLSAFRPMLKR